MKIYSFRPEEKFDPSGLSKYGLINIPLVSIIPRKSDVVDLSQYDSIAFLSSSAARYFFFNREFKVPKSIKIFAVGQKTAQEIPVKRERVAIPDIHDSIHVAQTIIESGKKHLLVPRGSEHTDAFENVLISGGVQLNETIVYTYGIGNGQKLLKEIQIIPDETFLLFTSPMEVSIFHRITGQKCLNVACAPLGEPTLKSVEDAGFTRIVKGNYKSFQSMVEQISKK